jgi:hypothetical protein
MTGHKKYFIPGVLAAGFLARAVYALYTGNALI